MANPRAGALLRPGGVSILYKAARTLEAPVYGLETVSPSEFRECVQRVSAGCDILVAAGGDTTVSLVVNTVDLSRTVLAYLPVGTGNALGYALGYGADPLDAARAITVGRSRKIDLMECRGGMKAFIASVGLDATAVRLRQAVLARGGFGLTSYAGPFLRALPRAKKAAGRLFVDDELVWTGRILTLMVVKHAYYGLGMRVVPGARLNDGLLHALVVSSSPSALFLGIPTAFLGHNLTGRRFQGSKVALEADEPVDLQVDGGPCGKVMRAVFSVVPVAARFRF
ncbi:MAG: diacylglycerol/lipid kinase family protein [Desulfobacteraceae bacterium]